VWVRAALHNGEARRLRVAASISLTEAGRSVDRTGTTVSRWETGERAPSEADALRYAAVLRTIERSLP